MALRKKNQKNVQKKTVPGTGTEQDPGAVASALSALHASGDCSSPGGGSSSSSSSDSGSSDSSCDSGGGF